MVGSNTPLAHYWHTCPGQVLVAVTSDQACPACRTGASALETPRTPPRTSGRPRRDPSRPRRRRGGGAGVPDARASAFVRPLRTSVLADRCTYAPVRHAAERNAVATAVRPVGGALRAPPPGRGRSRAGWLARVGDTDHRPSTPPPRQALACCPCSGNVLALDDLSTVRPAWMRDPSHRLPSRRLRSSSGVSQE